MPPTDSDVVTPLTAPKPNPRNNPVMFNIFQNVQYNVAQHKKYVKEMHKLYKKLDEESFRESFKNALYYLFTFGDTSANVDRIIQFVASFSASLDEEDELFLFIIDNIFQAQCVYSQAVRYRATQLLAAILAAMGDEASLDENLCESLLTSQLKRLEDARSAVRCRATLALQRLQNPMEQDDPVTRAYRFSMCCDPHSSVRRSAVMSIAKCTRNVPFVLERLRDVDEAVRRAAFLYIASITVTHMRVKQRLLTLKIGLTERCQRVRRVVEEILIPSWLASFKGNAIDLLKAIRLDNKKDAKDSKEVAAKLLDSLFKRLPISELLEWLPIEQTLRLIPAEKLNKETAWYWRHLAYHLQKIDDDDTLEKILPDLVVLTGYIKAIVESPCPSESTDPVAFSTRQYVLQELAALLKVYDASDPTSRSALKELISDVLTGDYGPLWPDVIRELVSTLELAVPELAPRLELVSGLITTLREPPEPEQLPPPPVIDSAELKLQKAQLRVALNIAVEAQEDAVMEQNYALAAECKAKVEEIQKELDELCSRTAPPPPSQQTVASKKSDAEILNKCLTILNCALDTPQLEKMTPMLKIIFSEMEEEIIKNPDVVETALETIALYGMLDREFVMEYKRFIFTNLMNISDVPRVCAVLRCILDLLCVHGLRVFDSEPDATEDATNTHVTTIRDDASVSSESALSIPPLDNTIIEILLKLMDSTCVEYRQIIAEGLCKLIHLSHLESPAIISRLLILWFSPATVDEDMLRQVIGMFFQTFPVYVDGAQEQIQKATIPTLRALAKAPSSSPLAEIDQEAIVRFIVSLTRVNYELCDSQGGMAEVLVGHLARRPDAPEAGLACRTLALLSPPRDASLASTLAAALRDLCLKITDKQSCRNLTKYLGALEAHERASLNKMSHTGVTEGTMQEDSLAPLGRTTSSLPQPIARSTHVVINETVEEEPEIEETSPPEVISTISEEKSEPKSRKAASTASDRSSTETETGSASNPDLLNDSSDEVSPVTVAKITKGKMKQLSLNRKKDKPVPTQSSKNNVNSAKRKSAEMEEESEASSKENQTSEESDKGGVKRTRSQRSLVDVDIALNEKAEKATSSKKVPEKAATSPPADFDTSNVTVRRSIQLQSRSSSNGSNKTKPKGKKSVAAKKPTKASAAKKRDSAGSDRSSAGSYQPFDDSDDSLHTIVYEKEFVQSVLNDSDELVNNKSTFRTSVTIPETPDPSDESELEISPEPLPKGKKNGKKK